MIDPLKPDYMDTPVSPRRPTFGYTPVDTAAAPCVTIITPFYNTGLVFRDTACSILQQSFQQWEWLIINDGSTDSASLALLQPYRTGDPRIRVIDHDTNKGLSAARNTGFREARTPYVVQLDSDDLLEPTAVEKWLWFLESYPEYAFVSGYSIGFEGKEYLWPHGFHDGSASLEDNMVDNKSMIRKAVCQAVGGYDETIREGGEDWEFWLRSANSGYWGGTVPEYLAWYRCRQIYSDRWANLDRTGGWQAFRQKLRQQYPNLWDGQFPQIRLRWHMANDAVPSTLPCENRLQKDKPRVLMIVPWLTVGGADKFNLDALEQLTRQGWEITVATTLKGDHSWLPLFARYTPDIFILHHFLRLVDYPRFLYYLIVSRQIDAVIISHSELGYRLLPYLRSRCPQVTFVDFCHAEAENWKNGGYPAIAIEYQEMLDLTIVASQHLQKWMGQKGAESERVQVCYINIDSDLWCPNPHERSTVRRELGIEDTVPMVLSVGRLCAEKASVVLARTIVQLLQKTSNCLVAVAGDGPEFSSLRAFIHRHGVAERVRLLGAVPNQRVRQLMTAADIFFLPSKWEGIALSIYEAMACGLPIVGANVGGQRELVTPECGILITRSTDDAEAEQYVQGLTDLLSNPRRRWEMGQVGRERVSAHFRLEQMGERMVFLLREAMRLHTDQPRPTPGPGLGQACAAEAIELTRLADALDGLWQERADAGLHPHLLDPYSDSWRTLAYFALRRCFLPYYSAALDREFTWLVFLKNRLKRLLLGTDQVRV